MGWIERLFLSKNSENSKESNRDEKNGICFGANSPETLEDEWRCLWRFINIWLGIDGPNKGFRSTAGKIDLSDLNGELSPAVELWIQLCEYLFSINKGNYLRDDPTIKHLPEVNATSILIQGENDFWWVIRDEDMKKDNPPIHAIGWDYDKEKYYELGECAPSIAFFALSHLMSYGASCPYFVISIDKSDVLIKILEKNFSNKAVFETMRIYEAVGTFILLRSDFNPSKWNTVVWLRSKSNYETLPPQLKALSKSSKNTTVTMKKWQESVV